MRGEKCNTTAKFCTPEIDIIAIPTSMVEQ